MKKNENNNQRSRQRAKFVKSVGEEFADLDEKLNEEEELVLQEIVELQEKINGSPTFMKDLLDAVGRGTMQYIDSMTDTGDTFVDNKNPFASRNNDEVVELCQNWRL